MTDRKIAKYNLEMAEHANGAAQYLDALLGGRYVTKEQTRDMVDYMFAGTKRNGLSISLLHLMRKRMKNKITLG